MARYNAPWPKGQARVCNDPRLLTDDGVSEERRNGKASPFEASSASCVHAHPFIASVVEAQVAESISKDNEEKG